MNPFVKTAASCGTAVMLLAGCTPGSAPDPITSSAAATTPAASPTTTPSTDAASAAPLAVCTSDEVTLEILSEPATAMSTLGVVFRLVDGADPCRLDPDTSGTLWLRDADGALLDGVAPNPIGGRVTGQVGAVDPPRFWFSWSGCAPGDGLDEHHEVGFEVAIEGFGEAAGRVLTPRCGEPGSGSTLRRL